MKPCLLPRYVILLVEITEYLLEFNGTEIWFRAKSGTTSNIFKSPYQSNDFAMKVYVQFSHVTGHRPYFHINQKLTLRYIPRVKNFKRTTNELYFRFPGMARQTYDGSE